MSTFDNGIILPPNHTWRRVKQVYTLTAYLLKTYGYNIMLPGRFTELNFLSFSLISLTCHSSFHLTLFDVITLTLGFKDSKLRAAH